MQTAGDLSKNDSTQARASTMEGLFSNRTTHQLFAQENGSSKLRVSAANTECRLNKSVGGRLGGLGPSLEYCLQLLAKLFMFIT